MLLDKLVYPILLLLGQYLYFILYLCYRNIEVINEYLELFIEKINRENQEKKEVFLIFVLLNNIQLLLLRLFNKLSNMIININNKISNYINNHKNKNITNLMKYLTFQLIFYIEYIDKYYYDKIKNYIKNVIFKKITDYVMKEINNNINDKDGKINIEKMMSESMNMFKNMDNNIFKNMNKDMGNMMKLMQQIPLENKQDLNELTDLNKIMKNNNKILSGLKNKLN